MALAKYVIASYETPGFHQWSGAPAHLDHLSVRHRHLFRFIVSVAVEGSDREVEFHVLRSEVEHVLSRLYPCGVHGFEFGNESCEMLAEAVLLKLREAGFNVESSEVWEDREHCGRVAYFEEVAS
jgi:hypothetical protein